jgi:hypothetical protein
MTTTWQKMMLCGIEFYSITNSNGLTEYYVNGVEVDFWYYQVDGNGKVEVEIIQRKNIED